MSAKEALSHLNHFCNKLPHASIAAPRPIFTTDPHVQPDMENFCFSCTVILPSSVDPSVREFSSSQLWGTEKMAKMDAAFQAIMALYRVGLLNNHFLPAPPVATEADPIYKAIAKRPAIMMTEERVNGWREVSFDILFCTCAEHLSPMLNLRV